MRYTLSNGKSTSDFSQAQTWAQAASNKANKAIVIIDNQGLSGLGNVVAIARNGKIQLIEILGNLMLFISGYYDFLKMYNFKCSNLLKLEYEYKLF